MLKQTKRQHRQPAYQGADCRVQQCGEKGLAIVAGTTYRANTMIISCVCSTVAMDKQAPSRTCIQDDQAKVWLQVVLDMQGFLSTEMQSSVKQC